MSNKGWGKQKIPINGHNLKKPNKLIFSAEFLSDTINWIKLSHESHCWMIRYKKASSGFPYWIWPQMVKIRQKQPKCTFFLSRIDPFPRTMILQPVSCSNCLVVIPRGPNMRPTKLNWKKKKRFILHICYSTTLKKRLKMSL